MNLRERSCANAQEPLETAEPAEPAKPAEPVKPVEPAELDTKDEALDDSGNEGMA